MTTDEAGEEEGEIRKQSADRTDCLRRSETQNVLFRRPQAADIVVGEAGSKLRHN